MQIKIVTANSIKRFAHHNANLFIIINKHLKMIKLFLTFQETSKVIGKIYEICRKGGNK